MFHVLYIIKVPQGKILNLLPVWLSEIPSHSGYIFILVSGLEFSYLVDNINSDLTSLLGVLVSQWRLLFMHKAKGTSFLAAAGVLRLILSSQRDQTSRTLL